ncbi:unannotated protein [freshwater metagenome]|uniref:Unannotated protein n=1 Tax=freshwater metagenome TaxID=449393 RepID=A0A6J6U3L6_9ZZZZ
MLEGDDQESATLPSPGVALAEPGTPAVVRGVEVTVLHTALVPTTLVEDTLKS